MPPYVFAGLFIAWTLWVYSVAMKRGVRQARQELSKPQIVPLTACDRATWLHTDRRSVSLSQSQ